jgi:integrase
MLLVICFQIIADETAQFHRFARAVARANMPRSLNKLSPLTLKKLSAVPGRHSDGGNLYLSVSPAGARRWVFMYRWRGRTIEMGLGQLDAVGLAAAREKARVARETLADGTSPLMARREQVARPTFGKVADDLIAALQPGWKNAKHGAQWRMTLDVYAKALRPMMVDEIGTEDVLRTLRQIWNEKPETASRTRMRIERVLDAARANGFRSGDNPARWKGHLDALLAPRQKLSRGHHAAMPYKVVPKFLAGLRASVSISGLALEFAVLTAARTGEVRGATWSEIDGDLWTVPAARMKEKREHRVPLVSRVIEILTLVKQIAGQRQSEFIFPGAKRGAMLSDAALSAALDRGGGNDFTVHGFRSSFRDWAGDETTFARETAEAALSHLVGDDSERAYRRGDALAKRKLLMEEWEVYCAYVTVDS